MSINIANDVEKNLIIHIADHLQSTMPRQTYLSPLDFRWANELTADLSEDANLKIDRHIGDDGLARFLYSYIFDRFLSGINHTKITKDKPLLNQISVNNPIQLARDIVGELKKIPFRYRLTIALPNQFCEPVLNLVDDRFDLPSQISISRPSSFENSLPIHATDPVIDQTLFTDIFENDDDAPRELDHNRFYFSMPMNGYAVKGTSTNLGRNFEDHIRAFYGASLATNLLSYGYVKQSTTLPYIMIHSEPNLNLIETERLEDDLIKNEFRFCTNDFVKTNKDDLKNSFSRTISQIATIFHEDLDCRKLHTACIWFYRAALNRRPLDSLLESTIAIEVMLGDKKASEGVGLSNLLGNRCAFLLGTSSLNRQKIMNDFQVIYRLRSNIVHEGRHSLQVGDRKIVMLSLRMCSAIITRELTIRARRDL